MAVIEARGLSKTFGDKPAVQDVSFRVEPGRVTGFLGPNGAGKSTTMRLMLALDEGRGTTTFDGSRYRDLPDPIRRVGALLDTGAFHPRRSARNHLRMIAAGSGVEAGRVDEVLELVGLGTVARARPGGYSLGMAQRLGLASAMLGRPDTLILDEPANGMDPQGMRWLRDFLKQYASEGNAVLVSSHLLSDLEAFAEHVIVIGQGRIIADASLDEFVRSHGLETVQVRSDAPDRLTEALTGAGGSVTDRSDDLLLVTGLSRREVAEAAASHHCPVHELFTTTGTLEQAFLRVSADSVDFDARDTEAGGTA